MSRTASGFVRLSRSGSPATSRGWSRKRSPRYASSPRTSRWMSTPHEPSRTAIRSRRIASRRSLVDVARVSGLRLAPAGCVRERRLRPRRFRRLVTRSPSCLSKLSGDPHATSRNGLRSGPIVTLSRMFDGPAALRDALGAIADNFSFTWIPGARELFAELDPDRFSALDHNPTALLTELSDEALSSALTPTYAERVARAQEAAAVEFDRTTWWQLRREDSTFVVAYFSSEFGLDESLPIYSGGLGVLAGDHLKSASELGVPLVALGLFYRHGYLQQQLDEHGWQTERYPGNDRARLPLTLEPVRTTVDLADESGALVPVHAQVWRAQVGLVPLYLLDTDLDGNPDWARSITDTLYGGDREHRIRQELVLGVGGVRVLRALALQPTVFHLNEGHSAFLQLERLRELVEE